MWKTFFYKPYWEVFAEGEKTICYIVFDGFRQPTPDCSEPNGDGRIPVSTRTGVLDVPRENVQTHGIHICPTKLRVSLPSPVGEGGPRSGG